MKKIRRRLLITIMSATGMLLLLLVIILSADNACAANDDRYELVFSDEFDLPNGSQPDATKWQRCQRGPSQWNRWISDSKDVVYIKGGKLICRAIPNPDLKADTAQMLTGAIESCGKFEFRYGKIEVRMKTNIRQGNFPAVWLPADKGDSLKRYGEIDVVEMFGDENCSAHTAHTHRSYALKKEGIRRDRRYKVNVRRWHVYGMEWDADRIIWTVDGREVFRYPRIRTAEMEREGQWTFDRSFFIRMNQSVGDGSAIVLTPHTEYTYETMFDWIRVYQLRK